jgi:hypothetical protein
MVTIDDGDEERSIVTPELRLKFRRLEDRWTHGIGIGPGPWLTLAEAVEWTSAADDPTRVVSPTYQDIHIQQDGADVLALLVGQAGPHHFSASLRVSHRVYDHERSRSFGLEYSNSRVEFDVADRCRAEVQALECNYVVHNPPVVTHLGDSRDTDAAEGFVRDWREILVWETCTENNYDVSIRGLLDHDRPTRVSLSDRDPTGGWRVRVAPRFLTPRGTSRIRYSWSYTRVLKQS